jgi:hypothetical protein
MTSRENECMGGLPIEVRDYAQLVRAIRSWIAELGVAGETVDDVAGLPLRYTMKLLGSRFLKNTGCSLGRTSMGPILGTLGLKLVVAVDHEVLERIRPRLIARHHASTALLAQGNLKKRPYLAFKGDPEIARMFMQRRVLSQSPSRRSKIARIAARERWRKAKLAENMEMAGQVGV